MYIFIHIYSIYLQYIKSYLYSCINIHTRRCRVRAYDRANAVRLRCLEMRIIHCAYSASRRYAQLLNNSFFSLKTNKQNAKVQYKDGENTYHTTIKLREVENRKKTLQHNVETFTLMT